MVSMMMENYVVCRLPRFPIRDTCAICYDGCMLACLHVHIHTQHTHIHSFLLTHTHAYSIYVYYTFAHMPSIPYYITVIMALAMKHQVCLQVM